MDGLTTFSKEAVLEKIDELKHLPFGEVNIDCKFNDIDYKLVLLASECVKDEELMDIIGKWRKNNEKWFSAQFNITIERTTKWFKEKLIDAPDRILFIIKVGDSYIGHVGLFRFDFENKACEIDNIIRGESAYPGIMYNAIKNMMDWGKDTLELKGYSLQAASKNERAMRLYEKLGFKEFDREPMMQIKGKEGLEWVKAPKNYDQKIARYNVIMKTF